MGHAKMPAEFGQAPHYVTLSGGWAYSISSKSAHPDEAFQVLARLRARVGVNLSPQISRHNAPQSLQVGLLVFQQCAC